MNLVHFVLLIAGLALTVKSADALVTNSSKIARRYGVSSFIIGITVVAFGTSAPELAVGIISGIQSANALTLGNIIGSGLANLALNIGLSALLLPLVVKDTVLRREMPMLLAADAALMLMLLDGQLSRLDGVLLLVGFAAFLFYVVRSAKASEAITIDPEGVIDTDGDGNGVAPQQGARPESLPKLWAFSLLGLVGLFLGGKLTVDSAVGIAQSLGFSETLIGLTVVALATTMPELITSIIAARKGEPEIVLGNCIGSNLFNILFILGTSTVIHPIAAQAGIWVDMGAMLVNTVVVLAIALAHRQIRRGAGIALLVAYIGYLVFKVVSVVL